MKVRADSCSRPVSTPMVAAGPELVQPGTVSGGSGSVAYLVPWGTAASTRFLANAMTGGIKVKSSNLAFTHMGTRYPSGTLIIDVADNDDDLPSTVAELASVTGANVVAADDSWVTDGPNFGSGNVVRFSEPKVAIAWDNPTSSSIAGNTRFVIERQFDYPVTAIRTSRMARSDLSQYHVILLPETRGSGYADVLGERGIDNLKDWVAKGGVLIGIGTANRFLTDPEVNLLSMRREDAVVDTEEEKGGDKADPENKSTTVPGTLLTNVSDYEARLTPDKGNLDSVAGVLVRADVDPDHWLGAGVASPLNVLIRGTDVYTPITIDKGVNVARFQGPDDLLASGYIWEENRKQLAYKPFVVAERNGRGVVIGFTQDPNVRAYLDGLNVIFMNAIFRGSAIARPIR